MRKPKALQILTVVSALVLFSAYVVYSQFKQAGTVAPSSKVLVLTNKGLTPAADARLSRAAGSNITIWNNSSGETNSGITRSELFFPGSKSGPIFVPERPQYRSIGK